MEEKELKTSGKQRFWIILIAIVMLGSVIASYAAVVLMGTGSSSSSTSGIDQAKIERYTQAYAEAEEAFENGTKNDFNEFVKYKTKITAYNEAAANGINVKTEDLKIGDGKTIQDGDTNYLAYYVGWCADETVFDSSFDSNTDPTAFSKMIDGGAGLIEGWMLGIEGMRLNGIRIITIPGSLAYGESLEICGGTNKPLKFMLMLKAKEEPILTLYNNLETAFMRLEYAKYGLDYDALMQ